MFEGEFGKPKFWPLEESLTAESCADRKLEYDNPTGFGITVARFGLKIGDHVMGELG